MLYIIYSVHVSTLYIIYSVYISTLYIIYSVHVSTLYIIYSVHVSMLYIIYSVHVSTLYIIYSVQFSTLYIIYSVHVSTLYIIYSVHVSTGLCAHVQEGMLNWDRSDPGSSLTAPTSIHVRFRWRLLRAVGGVPGDEGRPAGVRHRVLPTVQSARQADVCQHVAGIRWRHEGV